jgi:hypothetical protein
VHSLPLCFKSKKQILDIFLGMWPALSPFSFIAANTDHGDYCVLWHRQFILSNYSRPSILYVDVVCSYAARGREPLFADSSQYITDSSCERQHKCSVQNSGIKTTKQVSWDKFVTFLPAKISCCTVLRLHHMYSFYQSFREIWFVEVQ